MQNGSITHVFRLIVMPFYLFDQRISAKKLKYLDPLTTLLQDCVIYVLGSIFLKIGSGGNKFRGNKIVMTVPS